MVVGRAKKGTENNYSRRLLAVGDRPNGEDLLGYGPYVNSMAELLTSPALDTPFITGIYGAWGTGKSTFMQLVNTQLEQNGLNTVFFQPWQFEDKEEVWKALIYSVLNYLEAQSTMVEKENKRLKRLFFGVGKLVLNRSLQTIMGDSANIDQFIDVFAKTSRDNANFINTFRIEFQKIKEEILSTNEKNPKRRLVIFIDDLDRCTPENCIMVIEAIKLFFDLEECIFMLGIDREVIQKGIEYKYKGSISVSGKDYLEKIVQLPFTLPPISNDSFNGFVKATISEFDFDEQSLFLLTKASEKNPRRLKRLSNCLCLLSTVAQEIASDSKVPGIQGAINQSKLALLLVLQVRYPVIYHELIRSPENQKIFIENNDKEGNRDKLINSLTPLYGKDQARVSVEGFFSLMKESDISFKDHEEVKNYMEVTGVVYESHGEQSKHTSDIYDSKFHIEPAPEDPLDDNGEPLTGKPLPPYPGVNVDVTADDLLKDFDKVMIQWESLRNRPGWSLFFLSIKKHLRITGELVGKARVLEVFLKKHHKGLSEFASSKMLVRLSSVCGSEMRRDIASVLRLYTFLPVVFAGISLLPTSYIGENILYSLSSLLTNQATSTPDQINFLASSIISIAAIITILSSFRLFTLFNATHQVSKLDEQPIKAA
jgi:hypothetical protein